MKKLLWIGDAACPSGFALATHKILDWVRYSYDVSVLGLNYRGDPHNYPYPIYPARGGNDFFGVDRVHEVCSHTYPDLIVIQQDGWNIPDYLKMLRAKRPNGTYYYPDHAKVPVVAIVAVDGKNFDSRWLEGVDHTIFWTQFGLDEARRSHYTGPSSVIPLGVDLNDYYPFAKDEACAALGLSDFTDKFIVGAVNRNQPRKRWDLTIRYFADWVHQYHIDDAQLFIHAGPDPMGLDIPNLCRYYGIMERLAFREPPPFTGESTDVMRLTYCTFDVLISTTQGEGFGLTTLEAMACGRPCIVPDWAALGEWAGPGATLIPCSKTAIGYPFVNVIGGIPDEDAFISALHHLYLNQEARIDAAMRAHECANQLQYRWRVIGEKYDEVFADVLSRVMTCL